MQSTSARILDRFPKTRPELPDAFNEIYAEHYRANREGETPAASLSQRMESWLHLQVAKDLRGMESPRSTLEIGAGTLNQLRYEPEVAEYDIVEPFEALYAGSADLGRVRNIFSDVSDIPSENTYDRVTSIATFEHIPNLPEVVARCGLLLKPDGSLRVSIPSEGTILWTLGWKLTTGLEFRLKHGLDYGVLMKHEHLNTAREIEQVLGYFFSHIETRVFGLSKSISLYQFFACSNPRPDRCKDYLAQILKAQAGTLQGPA